MASTPAAFWECDICGSTDLQDPDPPEGWSHYTDYRAEFDLCPKCDRKLRKALGLAPDS